MMNFMSESKMTRVRVKYQLIEQTKKNNGRKRKQKVEIVTQEGSILLMLKYRGTENQDNIDDSDPNNG